VTQVAVLGAGPCGLRLAMETQLLGAETVVLEAREAMDRWPPSAPTLPETTC
jgi:2-polyprenyl-6-methoxyphenol hydroxylase-like FAD-dependent oxidoreductase